MNRVEMEQIYRQSRAPKRQVPSVGTGYSPCRFGRIRQSGSVQRYGGATTAGDYPTASQGQQQSPNPGGPFAEAVDSLLQQGYTVEQARELAPRMLEQYLATLTRNEVEEGRENGEQWASERGAYMTQFKRNAAKYGLQFGHDPV